MANYEKVEIKIEFINPETKTKIQRKMRFIPTQKFSEVFFEACSVFGVSVDESRNYELFLNVMTCFDERSENTVGQSIFLTEDFDDEEEFLKFLFDSEIKIWGLEKTNGSTLRISEKLCLSLSDLKKHTKKDVQKDCT